MFVGIGLTIHQGPTGGGGGDPPITLAAPTYFDNFDSYADGYRLVTGDPNANAGQVATNPGNLGWTAITSLTANNARFNPIIVGGKIVIRSANNFGEFSEPDTYVLSPGSLSGDQYIQAGLGWTAGRAEVTVRAVDQRQRIRIYNDGTNLNVRRYNGTGTGTSIAGIASAATSRKMGGATNGTMRLFNDTNEKITLITAGGLAYIRRGPGFPIGTAAGYSFTDPGGTAFGIPTYNGQHRDIDFIRVGAAPTVLLINETFNTWYPKRKAAAGDAITTGSAAINFSGTYLGTAPTRLQWALFDPETGATVKDWAWVPTAAQTIGGGNWSVSNLSIPVGLNGRKAYAIGFRPVDATNKADDGSAIVSIKHFYVALNIALIGQSNSGGLTNGMTSGNYPDFPGSAVYTKADPPSLVQGSYAENTGYYVSTTNQTGDKCTARLGDALSTQLDIPVCFEVMAIAATGAVNLGPGGTNWNYIQTHHAFAGGAFEMLYLSQGENEFVSGGSSWLTQWVDTNLPAYLAMSGQPTGTVIPIFQAWSGRHTGATSDTLASTKATREGQDAFVAYANAQLANVIAIPCHHYVGVKMIDAYHYTAILNEGYDEVSRRANLTVMKRLTGSGYDGMGPIATSARVSGNSIIITYDLNGATSLTARNGEDQSASSSATALTSWQASSNDFSSTVSPTSTSISGNEVTLNFAAPPTIGDKVRNHFGFQPDVTSWAAGAYADGSYICSKPVITPLVTT